MEIKPELTAIHRKNISYPLKQIIDSLNYAEPILDYGCGHGFDVMYLLEEGYLIDGYDKYIASSVNKITFNKYKFIYSFYVLNVIPDISERVDVLEDIKKLSDKDTIIYIAVRSYNEFIKNYKSYANYVDYGDGIVTKKKTFQKYYKEEEIIEFLKDNFKGFFICKMKTNKNTHLFKIFKDK